MDSLRNLAARYLPIVFKWALRLFVGLMTVVGCIITTNEALKLIPLRPIYISVVATETESNTQPRDFKLGFEGGDYPARVEMEKENFSDPEILAQKCIDNSACGIFVGNSTSTYSEKTLDIFLSHDKADRPVLVLPFATATDITRKATQRGYAGILRLIPDNANQAATIAELLVSLKNENGANGDDSENSANGDGDDGGDGSSRTGPRVILTGSLVA